MSQPVLHVIACAAPPAREVTHLIKDPDDPDSLPGPDAVVVAPGQHLDTFPWDLALEPVRQIVRPGPATL